MSQNDETRSAEELEEVQYDPTSSRYNLYECPDCDNVVLALGRDEPPMSCHGKAMERVTDVEMNVRPPDVKQVLLEAFGLPKAGLDICLCVIGEGPLSANEVAESLGYDRSTVTRYLNKLVDLGLLERSELNREEGGVVNVYHSVDLDRMRRETLIGFYVWAGEAAALIEDANLTKQDYLEENPDRELPDVFWESFSDG
jgi:predicted transcriptional regulator